MTTLSEWEWNSVKVFGTWGGNILENGIWQEFPEGV